MSGVGAPSARRWGMLAAAVFAQGSASMAMNGPAFLIPTLHSRSGLTLVDAGFVAAAPLVGVMVTLVAWGWCVDRYGERLGLLAGLVGTSFLAAVSTQASGKVGLALTLFLAGAFSASTSSASGRLIVGWFPPSQRGLAMGIRQMAQPLGVGAAAVLMAVLADRHGVSAALAVPAFACALAALVVALVVVDPPRPARGSVASPNPYRIGFLWRIHGVSVLLVIPQFVIWTYGLAFLIDERGWSAGAAGTLMAVGLLAGAVGRIGAGWLSDRVGSRVAPLRWIALAAGLTMGLLGLAAGLELGAAVLLLVVANLVTVADNGLAFTAVAEYAGPFWSGRALGIQNTTQFLTASAGAPLTAAAITAWGYPWAFGLALLGPLLAFPLVPRTVPEPL